jgi:prepilin-type N-terminal cleavage/methylation domain-containing protein
MHRARPHTRFAAPQRGLSLVELMVGIAVGLFVVAAAAMLVSIQLNENRRLLLETQMQQDLRATADIITRELRRAGHWPDAAQFVWIEGAVPPPNNPHSELTYEPNKVEFEYWRRPTESGPYGFKQDGSVLRTLLAGGGWQELTDGNTLRITAFSVTPRDHAAPEILLPCPKLCLDGTTDCWPKRTLTVRELVVDISGEAVVDPAVKRSLRSVVRLRNDQVGPPTLACPA